MTKGSMIKAGLKFLVILLGVFLIMAGFGAIDRGCGYLSELTDRTYQHFLIALVLAMCFSNLQTDE